VTRIVFDTTALSHFSRAERLDVLKNITASDECILLAERVVDDLIATEMRLPVASGADLFAWAYSAGVLP
jgi:hypothetical protein